MLLNEITTCRELCGIKLPKVNYFWTPCWFEGYSIDLCEILAVSLAPLSCLCCRCRTRSGSSMLMVDYVISGCQCSSCVIYTATVVSVRFVKS
eukprot:5907391-Amphidinium_carterae.1